MVAKYLKMFGGTAATWPMALKDNIHTRRMPTTGALAFDRSLPP